MGGTYTLRNRSVGANGYSWTVSSDTTKGATSDVKTEKLVDASKDPATVKTEGNEDLQLIDYESGE